jgi:hypothetical protein
VLCFKFLELAQVDTSLRCQRISTSNTLQRQCENSAMSHGPVILRTSNLFLCTHEGIWGEWRHEHSLTHSWPTSSHMRAKICKDPPEGRIYVYIIENGVIQLNYNAVIYKRHLFSFLVIKCKQYILTISGEYFGCFVA